MTAQQLQAYLQSEKPLTLNKVKDIIYECKNDIVGIGIDVQANPYTAGYYAGESNAFYICLDLLDKVEDRFKAMGLRRRFDILAEAIGLERTADPREILDTVIEKKQALREKLKDKNIFTAVIRRAIDEAPVVYEVEVSNRANLQDHIMSLIPDTIDTDAGTHVYLLYQERLKIAEAIAAGFIKPIKPIKPIEEFVDKLATIDMPYAVLEQIRELAGMNNGKA